MTSKQQNVCAVVIVHGQSEYALINSIKSKLRVNLKVFSRDKGKTSIQINGLSTIFENSIFKSKNKLLQEYPGIKKKKNKLDDFKIFTFMDVDDCSDISVKNNYLDGHLSDISKHPLREYFYPIYCDENLEAVLDDVNFPFIAKTNRQKKKYIVVFDSVEQIANEENIQDFCDKLKKSEKTNLEVLVKYMLDHKFEIKS
ncbi:hypothetical protein [Latilactobacillus sakei]|uniref:hypothetical protein n=1 Tax=Latilactobacillus sakei TaxID=1599 RepID=UPI002072D332|nr:hypothetical protein [Latilactobacillus sakei]